jgi:hypothetical protein
VNLLKKKGCTKLRLVACLIAISSSVLAFSGKGYWKKIRIGNPMLIASIEPDQLDIGRIELIDDHRYYATFGHIDWSCSFTNTYKIANDTLFLSGSPFVKTDGIITNSYLITDTTLIPIDHASINRSRPTLMKIVKRNE